MGIIMLNYPFIQIFNKDITCLGIPLILVYFLVGCPLAIAITYLFSKKFRETEQRPDSEKKDHK